MGSVDLGFEKSKVGHEPSMKSFRCYQVNSYPRATARKAVLGQGRAFSDDVTERLSRNIFLCWLQLLQEKVDSDPVTLEKYFSLLDSVAQEAPRAKRRGIPFFFFN